MEVNFPCPCFTWTKLEPLQGSSAPPPSILPKALPEQLKEEMMRRYQSTPGPDPRPPRPPPVRAASPSLTSPNVTQTTALSLSMSPNLPPARLRQQKSLVREDNYGFEMAMFYGEVQRRDTLNSSAPVKSTPLPQSPNLSFQH